MYMNWRDTRDPVEVDSGPTLNGGTKSNSKANNVVAAIVHEVDGGSAVQIDNNTTEEKEVQNLSEYFVEKVLSPDKAGSPPFQESIEVTKKSVNVTMAGEEDQASNNASSRVSSAAKSSKIVSEAGEDHREESKVDLNLLFILAK